MALKDIKSEIASKLRTNKVTRAMEAVSAVKMRKTQQTALGGRGYAHAALSILSRLSGSNELARNPLTAKRDVKTMALVIITSDKGLAGALNSSVIKAASAAVDGMPKEAVKVYAYGRKGEEHFARRGYPIVRSYQNKRDDIPLEDMEALSKELSAAFVAREVDSVVAVYSHFKSTFEQLPTARTLLPLSIESVRQMVADIRPTKGKWSDEKEASAPAAYVVEPSPEVILDALVPRLVAVSLYHMLLEAKASEHSARMVAMKNASDKSKEVAKDLTRTYNKVRQAAITREVSEIVGGREALAS